MGATLRKYWENIGKILGEYWKNIGTQKNIGKICRLNTGKILGKYAPAPPGLLPVGVVISL